MDWLWSLSGPRRASNAAALPVSPASAQASSVQVNSSASDLSNITLDLSDVLAFEAAVQALKNNQSDDSCLQHAISRLQHLIRSDRELNRSHPFAELPRTRAAKQIVIQVGVTQFVSLVGFQFDIALDILHRIPTFNASLAIPRCGLIQFLQFLPVLICSADDARAMVGTSFLQSLFRIIEHIFSSKPHVDTPPTDNTAKMASIQWIDELSDCIPVLDKLAALPEKLFIIGLVSCALLLRLSKVPSLADDLPVQRLFAWVADISFSENSVSSNKTQFAIKVLREMVAHGGSTSICTSQACFILISNFLNGINSQNPLHSCIASDEFELLRDILRKNPLQARTSMTSDDAWLSGPVFDQFSTYFRASLSRVSASANISAESGPKSDESCFNLVKAHFAMSQSEVWVEQQLVVGQRALSNYNVDCIRNVSAIRLLQQLFTEILHSTSTNLIEEHVFTSLRDNMLFAIINSFHSLQLQHPFNVLILQALHIGATLSATLPTLHSIDIHSVIFKYLEFEFEASPSGAFPSILAMTDILNGINQTLELNHTNIPVSICKFLGKLLKRSSGSNGVAASAVAEQSRREAELRFLFEHSNVLDVCFELLKTLVANLPLWSCFDSANSFMDLVIELCLLTKHMLFQNPTMRSKFFDVLHGRQALKSILQHISSASFQLEAGSGASILLADTLSAVLDVWRSMTDFESIAHLLQSCFETRMHPALRLRVLASTRGMFLDSPKHISFEIWIRFGLIESILCGIYELSVSKCDPELTCSVICQSFSMLTRMIKSKSFYRVHLWTEIGWECLASLLVRTDIFCTSLWPQIFDSLLFMAIEGDTKQNSDIIGSRNIIRNADCLLVVLACLQHCASQQSQPNQIISAVLNDWVTIIRADIEDGALNNHFNRQTVFEVGAAAHFVQSFCSSNGLNINCLDPSSELFDTAMQFLVEVASFSTSASTIHAIFQLPAAVRTKVLNNISLRQSLFRSRPVLVSTVPSAQPSEVRVVTSTNSYFEFECTPKSEAVLRVSHVGPAGKLIWPNNGVSVSCWFTMVAFPNQSTLATQSGIILFDFGTVPATTPATSSSQGLLSAVIGPDGNLRVQSVTGAKWQLLEFRFVCGQWYHVVFTHSIGGMFTDSVLKVFVNGREVVATKLAYPPIDPIAIVSVQAQFGCLLPIRGQNVNKSITLPYAAPTNSVWRLGNLMLISKVLDVNEIAEMTIAGPSYLGSFSKFRCTTSAANSFSLSENDIVFCFHPLAVSKFDMFAPLLPSSALTLESIFNQSDQSATSIELLSPTSQSYLMRRHSSVENVSSPSAFSAASRSNISQSIDAYVTNVRKLSPSWKDTMTLLSSPFSNGFLSHNAAAFVALPSRTLHWFAAARSSQQIESDELKAATPFVFRSGLVPLLDFGTVNGTSGLGLRSNKPHAIAMGSCYCYNALDVFDAFQSCIGISSLIASFEQVKSPQELYSALVAIGSCLHHSVSSQTEMETCGGYLILSKTLSEHTAWIDERIANLLIAICEGRDVLFDIRQQLSHDTSNSEFVQSNQLQLDLKSNRDASIPSERFVLFAANRDSSFSGHLVHQIDHQNIDSTKQPTYRYRIPSRHESVVANVLACKHLLLNPQILEGCSSSVLQMILQRVAIWCSAGPKCGELRNVFFASSCGSFAPSEALLCSLKDEVGHSVRTDAVVSISGNREVVPLLDDFESRNFELLHVRAVSNADFKANFVMTSIRTPFSVNNSSNIRMPNVQATVQPTSSSWTDGNHVDALYNTHVLRSFGAFSVLLRCFARLCDLEASGIELPAAEQTLWINVFQGFLLDGLSTAELHELLAMIVHAATLLQRPESTCLTIVSRVVETLSKCCAIAQSAPLTSHLHRIIQQLETINIHWFEVLMSTNVLPVLHQAALHLFCSLCLYSPIFHRRSVKLFGFIAHLLSQSVSVNVLAILISTLCGAPVDCFVQSGAWIGSSSFDARSLYLLLSSRGYFQTAGPELLQSHSRPDISIMLLSLIAQHSKRQSSSSLSTDETTSLNGFLLNESMSFLNATAKRSVKFLEFLRRSQDCVESLIVVVSACADFFGKQSDDLSFDCANAHIAHQLLLMIAFRSIFTSSNSLFVSNSVPGSVVPFDFAEFKLILRIALCCDLSAEKSYVVRLLADCRGQVHDALNALNSSDSFNMSRYHSFLAEKFVLDSASANSSIDWYSTFEKRQSTVMAFRKSTAIAYQRNQDSVPVELEQTKQVHSFLLDSLVSNIGTKPLFSNALDSSFGLRMWLDFAESHICRCRIRILSDSRAFYKSYGLSVESVYHSVQSLMNSDRLLELKPSTDACSEKIKAIPDVASPSSHLDIGDRVPGAISLAYSCSRIDGLRCINGVLLGGVDCLYLIDGWQLTSDFNAFVDESCFCVAESQDDNQSVMDLCRIEVISANPSDVKLSAVKFKKGEKPDVEFGHRVRCRKWSIKSVCELRKRRYQLSGLAIELFLKNGATFLLTFPSTKIRDEAFNALQSLIYPDYCELDVSISQAQRDMQRELVCGGDSAMSLQARITATANPFAAISATFGGSISLSEARTAVFNTSATQRWVDGQLSNFEYLMHLNSLAGRSHNDLTQYPVFPWILSDYTSESIDLNDESVYRDLSKPMGALGAARAKEFQNRFEHWDDPNTPPFHYGTHYSSAGGVLSYLIRMEPYTRYALELQSGKFDHADRLFYSVARSFALSSNTGGLSDVKELIPEFFCLPEFLINRNRWDFGSTQHGVCVDHVELPPWAHNDPERFIRIQRQALESPYVSAHLHEWIDLIFGHKQRGQAAIDAQNVFYHLTYQDSFDIDSIADPIDRQSVLAQVNNFGQTPMQLFTRPHPARKSAMAPSVATHCELSSATHVATVPNSVSSLVYVGTGDVQSAVQTNENSATLVESIVEVSHTTLPAQLTQSTTAAQQPVKTEQRNDVNVRAVGSCRVLLPPIFDRFLEFGHADCSLRVGVCDNVPNSNILRMHPAHKPGDLLCIWENLLSSFKDQSRNGTSKSLNFAELVVDSAGISKPEQISSVSVSDDGRLVFVGGERGSLCVLRIRTPEELLRQNEAARKSHVAQVQLRQQQLARYGQAVTASQQAQQQLIETSSAQSSTASKALQHIGSALAGAASAALRPMSSALQQASMALQDSFGSFSQSLYKAAPAPATLTAVDAGAEFCRQPFELVGFLRGGHCDGAGITAITSSTAHRLIVSGDEHGRICFWDMFSLRLLRQATHRVPKCASSLLSDVFNESSIDRHSNLVPVWPITSLAISPDTFGDVFSASGATLHAYTNNGVFLCGTRLNQGKFAPEQTGISAVEQTNAEILTLAVTKQSHENLLLCGHVDGAIRIVALQVNAQRSTDSVHFVHKHTLHPSAVFRQSNSSIDNDMPVCALHTSHTAVDSFWSADAAGRVLRWTVQPFAKHWVPDDAVSSCQRCSQAFGTWTRRHHCRSCGRVMCSACSDRKMAVPALGMIAPARVCEDCWQQANQAT